METPLVEILVRYFILLAHLVDQPDAKRAALLRDVENNPEVLPETIAKLEDAVRAEPRGPVPRQTASRDALIRLAALLSDPAFEPDLKLGLARAAATITGKDFDTFLRLLEEQRDLHDRAVRDLRAQLQSARKVLDARLRRHWSGALRALDKVEARLIKTETLGGVT